MDMMRRSLEQDKHEVEFWTGDVDGLRLYLARIDSELGNADFDVEEFVLFYNTVYIKDLLGKVNSKLSRLNDEVDPSDRMVAEISALRGQFIDILSPQDVSISAQVFEHWIAADKRHSSDKSADYWWLKGIALLGYPFAPDLCTQLWHILGHQGFPVFSELFDIREIQTKSAVISVPKPISATDVHNLIDRPQ